MTTGETISLIKALKEAGAISFKSATIEIHLAPAERAAHLPVPTIPRAPVLNSGNNSPNGFEKNEVHEIPHKETPYSVNKIRTIMQMPDDQLVDAMFPETPEPEEEIEA